MSSEHDEVIQDVHAVANAVTQIIAAHLPNNSRDGLIAELVDYVKGLHAIGGTQLECVVVIGALRALGYKDFASL